MFLTITSIVVAALFGFSFACALRQSYVNGRLRHRIDKLKGELSTAYAERNKLADTVSEQATCLKRKHVADFSEKCEYAYMSADCGFYTVVRRVKVDGHEFTSIIKRFTDEDTDFNRNEAEELCDMLNS